MEDKWEKEIELKSCIQKVEEKRDFWERMKIDFNREEEDELVSIHEMEQSVEQMKECCSSSDYEILQLLEEKNNLIRTLKSKKEEFRDEYEQELRKEYQKLDLEQEETENEIKRFYSGDEIEEKWG